MCVPGAGSTWSPDALEELRDGCANTDFLYLGSYFCCRPEVLLSALTSEVDYR